MAIIKFINNKNSLKKTIDYICKEEKTNNKLITGDLINLLKNIRQLKKNWDTRIYKTRVLEDLKVSKMKQNKEGEE